jgi:hypothetical protein
VPVFVNVKLYPQQSSQRYQLFIKHMVPDAKAAVCRNSGGCHIMPTLLAGCVPSLTARVTLQLYPSLRMIAIPVGASMSSGGTVLQHARAIYMESRLLFLTDISSSAGVATGKGRSKLSAFNV